MNLIDQNTALLSLKSALKPGLKLIDSRGDIDRLKFLTEYASLINFYDEKNNINGSWNPFLMKDPVFLLANAARVNHTKLHSLYKITSTNLKQLISDTPTQGNISIYFNQLFNQLLEVFIKIERWSHFMDKYHHEYSLKEFVIHKLKLKFSFYFWALIALWEELASNQTIKGVQTIDTTVFNTYSKSVWAKSNEPFWKTLNIQMPLNATKEADENAFQEMLNKVLNSLVLVGDQLFSFLSDIISHASTEYDSLSVRKGVFPDTSLLRAFVKLQGVQQEQLNGISKKHLEFYFEDILKQKKRNAEGDKTFISAELAKKDNTFQLSEGTLFKAGVDANKKPIIFKSLNSTNLNPGSVTGGYTLMKNIDSETGLTSIYKTSVDKPGTLKKNKSGQILGWATFGGNAENLTTPESLGFAIASPMFYLKEGLRVITLKLTFKEVINQVLFKETSYFLSTGKKWLPLVQKPQEGLSNFTGTNFWEILPSQENSNELNLKIILGVAEKPVEKFIKNPDGYTSDWPIFKMVFNKFDRLEKPPVFSSIDIKVDVSNVKSFSLSNDFGVLSTKKPYQLFGPTPLPNSSFFIGNDEIFSKPISFLNVNLDWNALLSDFQKYYESYNTSLDINNNIDSLTTKLTTLGTTLAQDQATLVEAKQAVESAVTLANSNTKIASLIEDVSQAQIIVDQEKVSMAQAQASVLTANDALVNANSTTKSALSKDLKAKQTIEAKTVKAVNSATSKLESFEVKVKNAQIVIANTEANTELSVQLAEKTQAVDQSNAQIVDVKQQIQALKTHPFNNNCFTCDFEVLQNKKWNALTATKETSCVFNHETSSFSCAPYTGSADEQGDDNSLNELLFGTTDGKLSSNSVFSFQLEVNEIKPDPSLQLTGLTYKENSQYGFVKMSLTGPEYGFGSDVYGKVVSNIALLNAAELMNKKVSTNTPANLPYAPTVKLLTANYSASESYQLDFIQSEEPLQCFSYTPNNTYKVYDNLNTQFDSKTNRSTLDGIANMNVLPLFPALESNGVLYLSIDKLVAPCDLNLYFELARKTGSVSEKGEINCRYLTGSGWKDMPVLSDGTNNFTCSGILKVSISDEITSNHISMPNDQFWLSIGVPNDPNSYADTIYLQTNGFEVERIGTSFLSDMNTPKLPAGVITKSLNHIPEISKVVQTFPSFSGRGAEDELMMNKRVSTRLRTKDRVINSVDYFRMIQQEFPDIFYSKCVYDKVNRKTNIYLVKKFEDVNDVGAFIPLVSVCKEKMVSEYLSKRAPAFANIEVLNFVPEYVSVTANVSVDKNYGLGEMEKTINTKINIFLSPWIESNASQLKIDKGLTKTQISNLIKCIEGVISVSSIEIDTTLADSVETPCQTLLVTSDNHVLKCSHLL